jgi:large subunit ribosomal protein L17
MRHLKSGRKLNRTSAHRKAMLSNMVTSLLWHESVRTTDAKAKELRRWAERMVTLGKRGTLHARRQVLAFVRSRKVVTKLFDDIAPRFRERPGGYTRVTKLGPRRGDSAPVSVIELTERSGRALSEAQKKRERRARAHKKKQEAAAKAGPRLA